MVLRAIWFYGYLITVELVSGDSAKVNKVNEDNCILRVEGVSVSFGGVQAVDKVSFEIKSGEILAIIGPNGAGKSSVLNCISGFYKVDSGRIVFEGRDITRLPPYKIAQFGIARTFQGIQIYLGMTTLDNLLAGRHVKIKTNVLEAALHWPWVHKEEIENRRVVEDIIDFLEIEAIRKQPAGVLGYGLRKRIDLGRALALEPKLLLLDEPMAGMNVEEKEDMARFILDIIEARNIPIILVEHDMEVVMDIADRVVVLDWGHKVAEGAPDIIRNDPWVIKAYIGD